MKQLYLKLFLALMLINVAVFGATITSNIATGNWSTASTWSPATVPTAADDVIILAGHSITINSGTASHAASLDIQGTLGFSPSAGPITINGNLDVSGTFNVYNGTAGKRVVLLGNLTNTGTIDFSVAPSSGFSLTMSGTSKQIISGNGVFMPIRSIAIDNAFGVDLKSAINISGILYLAQGVLNNDPGLLTIDNKIKGNAATAATTAEIRRTQVSSLGNPIAAPATTDALLNLNYLTNASFPDATIVEGNEIPTDRVVNAVTMNNNAGLTVNDDLVILSASVGALTLTAGIIKVANGKTLNFTNGAYLGATGSLTSFVDGAVLLTIGNLNTRTWPIGSVGKNRKVTITDLVREGMGSGVFTIRFAIEAPGVGTAGPGVNSISPVRRWVSTVTPGTDNTTLGSFGNISFDYFDGVAEDGTNIDEIASSATAAGVYTNTYATATIVNATSNGTAKKITSATGTYTSLDSYFALGSTTTVLPVDLYGFSLQKETNGVKINWKTASENNNDKFEVQRSADGINYTAIATVKGKGNSSVSSTYEAYDQLPLQGVSYYRIVQYDLNGNVTTYEAKALNFQLESTISVSVYPNPTTKGVMLRFANYPSADANITLTDLNSKQILIKQLSGNDIVNGYYLPLGQSLANGLYILTVSAQGLSKSIRVIKQ